MFVNPQGLPGARRLLGCPTAHYEPRKGSHEQALAYCHKDETREPGARVCQFGTEPVGQGTRTDWQAVKSCIDNGGGVGDLAESHFGLLIRYERGLTSYANRQARKRSDPPRVYYFWGPSGTGKSRAAWSFDSERTFSVPIGSTNGAVWFDGYDSSQHDVVLLDDYYSNYKYTYLLQLLDRYPLQVPVKGGFVNFNSPIIVITSNDPVTEQYRHIENKSALWRRLYKVVLCTEDRWDICTERRPIS